MKLEWMGEHREIVEALIHDCNIYAGVYRAEKMSYEGITYSYAQIQVLEYLLENEERGENMRTIARRLGISRSNFTKIINRLEQKGLVEKSNLNGSHRDICISVNDLGRKLYDEYALRILRTHFSPMFRSLDKLSPDARIYIRDALQDAMGGRYDQAQEKTEG